MTVLEERLARLQAMNDEIAAGAFEALTEQAKKAAANLLLMYGSKTCLDAGGFIHCVQSAHEAALLFLLDEGYVTLTEKGQATEAEKQARKNRRDLQLKDEPSVGEQVITRGAYL